MVDVDGSSLLAVGFAFTWRSVIVHGR